MGMTNFIDTLSPQVEHTTTSEIDKKKIY